MDFSTFARVLLCQGDWAQVLAVLPQELQTGEHQAFVERLNPEP